MSGWKFDDITKERRAKAEDSLAGATTDQLLDHIAKVEAALYTLTYSLNDLDIEPGPRRSARATSKLFPSQFDHIPDGLFAVYNSDKHEFEATTIPVEELHAVQYAEAESISIEDGSKLSDDFEIIAVHQSAPCAYVGCGSIWMRDVRRAASILWPPKPAVRDTPPKPEQP